MLWKMRRRPRQSNCILSEGAMRLLKRMEGENSVPWLELDDSFADAVDYAGPVVALVERLWCPPGLPVFGVTASGVDFNENLAGGWNGDRRLDNADDWPLVDDSFLHRGWGTHGCERNAADVS